MHASPRATDIICHDDLPPIGFHGTLNEALVNVNLKY